MTVGEGDQRDDLAVELVEQVEPQGRRARRQRGVEHVLAGQPAVQPPRGLRVPLAQPLPQQGQEGYDGVAGRGGLEGDPGEVRPATVALVEVQQVAEVGPVGVVRRDPLAHERVQPGLLDLDHGQDEPGGVEVQPRELVAGPQQVGHQAPGWVRKPG